jgi:hypothetical protein
MYEFEAICAMLAVVGIASCHAGTLRGVSLAEVGLEVSTNHPSTITRRNGSTTAWRAREWLGEFWICFAQQTRGDGGQPTSLSTAIATTARQRARPEALAAIVLLRLLSQRLEVISRTPARNSRPATGQHESPGRTRPHPQRQTPAIQKPNAALDPCKAPKPASARSLGLWRWNSSAPDFSRSCSAPAHLCGNDSPPRDRAGRRAHPSTFIKNLLLRAPCP